MVHILQTKSIYTCTQEQFLGVQTTPLIGPEIFCIHPAQKNIFLNHYVHGCQLVTKHALILAPTVKWHSSYALWHFFHSPTAHERTTSETESETLVFEADCEQCVIESPMTLPCLTIPTPKNPVYMSVNK